VQVRPARAQLTTRLVAALVLVLAPTAVATASAPPSSTASPASSSNSPASETSPNSPASETSPSPPVGRVLSASVAPGELAYGAALAVTGRLTDAGQGVGGAPVALQAAAYPFRRFATVARLATGPDGGFAFTSVRPDRDTRLRVVAEGPPAAGSGVLTAIVDPVAAINARSLGPGRVYLSLRLSHTLEGGSSSVSARWFLAARGRRVFRLAAVTLTHELARGLTYASVTVNPPARRFVYRVCLNPTWERAMGAPATHRACPEHDFTVPRRVR